MTEVDVYNDPAMSILVACALDAGQHYKWVPFDDLYQEAWLWRISHPQLTEKLLEQSSSALQRAVNDHLRLVAQRERAQQTGFQVEDPEYYTPRMIGTLLPQALDIIESTAPKGGASDDIRGAADPHGQSGFLTSLIDVANAWITTSFRRDEQQILRMRYIKDLNWHEIAGSIGLEVEEVKHRAAQGLRRMVWTLGGFRGRSCPVDCPDHVERVVAEIEGESNE